MAVSCFCNKVCRLNALAGMNINVYNRIAKISEELGHVLSW